MTLQFSQKSKFLQKEVQDAISKMNDKVPDMIIGITTELLQGVAKAMHTIVINIQQKDEYQKTEQN